MTLEPGTEVESYRIRQRIGEGGSAAVYQAVHARLGSLHALKVLEWSSPEARRQLILEGRVQAGLRHPNLVAVTDLVHVGEQPALVLEYVHGPTLEDFVHRGRPPLEVALSLFRGIVRGVDAAHAAGLVHRDLKPGNILIATVEGGGLMPKITDFGLAKVPGAPPDAAPAIGTPHYMAPEQHLGHEVDQRADLWSLGVILYELVTGRRPFAGRGLVELADAICSGRHVAPQRLVRDLPENVRAAIAGLLEVDPDRRIGSCAELLAILDRPAPAWTADTLVPAPARVHSPSRTRQIKLGRRLAFAAWATALAAGGLLDLWLVTAPARAPEVVMAAATAAPAAKIGRAPAAPIYSTGALLVQGDASVWLTDADGWPVSPGALPAGTYHWRAAFEDGQVDGRVHLDEGERATLVCTSLLMQCRTLY